MPAEMEHTSDTDIEFVFPSDTDIIMALEQEMARKAIATEEAFREFLSLLTARSVFLLLSPAHPSHSSSTPDLRTGETSRG